MEKTTKGEKTKGKIAGPLFPRLHVDETKKIGPRAPPRNKMALYEQLSIPSRRFNNTTPTLPPSPIYGCMLTNNSSSSQGVDTQRCMLSTFQKFPIQVHSNGRQTPSNEGISENSTGNSFKRSLNVADNTVPTLTFRPSFEPYNLSQFKLPPFLPKDEAAGLRFPTFIYPQITNKHYSTRDHFQVGTASLDLKTPSPNKSRPYNLTSMEDQTPTVTLGPDKNPTPIVQAKIQAKDNIFSIFFLKPDTTEKEHSEASELQLNGEYKKNCELNQSGIIKDQTRMNLSTEGDTICRGDASSEEQTGLIDKNGEFDFITNNNVHDQTKNSGNVNQHEEKSSSTYRVKFEYKNEDLSYTPVKDGASCAVISPEVLMEMIGQKYFWQARKAMVHQQRAFSMQVCELHRIVKVQRMLTDSGNIQQIENLPFSKSLIDQPFMIELLAESFPEAPSWKSRLRNEVAKTKLSADCPIGKPPLSSDTQIVPSSSSVHNFSKSAIWGLTPPGNQWLLPVFSPSEGLVYKPYSNHLPLGPLYNECGPANTEFFSSSGSGVCGPAPLDPSYLGSYGMPVMNPFGSRSPVKKMTARFNNGYPSSSVLTVERNLAGVKDREKLESTASGPKNRAPNDALPLFPINPTSLDVAQPVQSCNNDQQKTQVIKVIPRNPKLASESAARIVKLIQDERKNRCN